MKPRAPAGPRLHSLELPLKGLTLIVPSASVAEVINPIDMTPVPFGEPWLKGVIGWRTLAVPVISLEVLLGTAPPAPPEIVKGKIVIFYPLSGRKEWEFYALLVAAEPRPQVVDGSQAVAGQAEFLESPYIAAGLRIGEQLMLVPNLGALRKTFYPT
jgi:chemotaxis signal transduction protein